MGHEVRRRVGAVTGSCSASHTSHTVAEVAKPEDSSISWSTSPIAHRASRLSSPTVRYAERTSRGFRTITGCPVISPARRKRKERGGIVIGKYGHAAAQLPPSRARTTWIEKCAGHVLYAAGGTIYERIVTADGSLDFVEVT